MLFAPVASVQTWMLKSSLEVILANPELKKLPFYKHESGNKFSLKLFPNF